MKSNKLEKKTVFLFKKNNTTNLTKEQMRKVNGGNTPDKPSAVTACTIAHLPTGE